MLILLVENNYFNCIVSLVIGTLAIFWDLCIKSYVELDYNNPYFNCFGLNIMGYCMT